jgi:hypothetical protein
VTLLAASRRLCGGVIDWRRRPPFGGAPPTATDGEGPCAGRHATARPDAHVAGVDAMVRATSLEAA